MFWQEVHIPKQADKNRLSNNNELGHFYTPLNPIIPPVPIQITVPV